MADSENAVPTQKLRDQLAAAIKANDVTTVKQLLVEERLLANTDLREVRGPVSLSRFMLFY